MPIDVSCDSLFFFYPYLKIHKLHSDTSALNQSALAVCVGGAFHFLLCLQSDVVLLLEVSFDKDGWM